MNRSGLIVCSFLLLVLVLGVAAGCSGQDRDSNVPSRESSEPETVIEAPIEEPTVLEPTTRSPEELSRAQRQLDAQCAQMDIQEAQEMGVPPEEYGCEADGTGIPVREWIEQGR